MIWQIDSATQIAVHNFSLPIYAPAPIAQDPGGNFIASESLPLATRLLPTCSAKFVGMHVTKMSHSRQVKRPTREISVRIPPLHRRMTTML